MGLIERLLAVDEEDAEAAPAAGSEDGSADSEPRDDSAAGADSGPPAEPPPARPRRHRPRPAEAVTEPGPVGEAPAAPPPAQPQLGAAPGPILATDPLSVAGRKAMWIHLDRLLKSEQAMRDPEHADQLRKYRVATRRLRAAIRLFRPAYKAADLDPIADGLAEIADSVAVARDLDVRAAGLRTWAAARGAESEKLVQPLLDTWSDQRRIAMDHLEGQLASRRHQRLLTRLVAFVEHEERPGRPERPGQIVRDRAGSQSWRAFEKVREFAPSIRWADVPSLHRVRIEAKRLRYSLEFLRDVLGPDVPWLVERLVALQDQLGELNDTSLTAAAVREFLDRHQARLTAAEQAEISAYLADRERLARSLRRGVTRPWRTIAGVTFARRLARTVIVR